MHAGDSFDARRFLQENAPKAPKSRKEAENASETPQVVARRQLLSFMQKLVSKSLDSGSPSRQFPWKTRILPENDAGHCDPLRLRVEMLWEELGTPSAEREDLASWLRARPKRVAGVLEAHLAYPPHATKMHSQGSPRNRRARSCDGPVSGKSQPSSASKFPRKKDAIRTPLPVVEIQKS